MFSLIADVIHRTGLLGVGLLMLIENLIPVIPSELIMPMAGFEAAQGAFHPLWATLAGAVGSIIGGAAWYGVGRRVGSERLLRWAAHGGRWLTLTPEEVRRGEAWFARWGAAAVCIGRALPGVRGVICIPAGLARMAFGPFLVWSSLGALIWSAFLVSAGYALRAHYAEVRVWLDPVTDVAVALALAFYLWRVVRYKPASR